MKKKEFHWNVFVWDVNKDEIESHDVGRRFMTEYKSLKKKERENLDISAFLDRTAKYYFRAKCEYEMICCGWPKFKNEHKLDVYEQLKANWDNFVTAFETAIS